MNGVSIAEVDPDTDGVSIMTPMSLHLDQSPTPSSAAEAATTEGKYRDGVKGKKPLAHKLWSHSKGPDDGLPLRNKHRQRIFYCKHCTTFAPSPNLDSIRRHLTKDHGFVIEEDERKLAMQIKGSLETFWRKKPAETDPGARDDDMMNKLGRLLDQDAIDFALVTLITRRNLPYTCVQWPELHALVSLLNPAAGKTIVRSHTTVPRRIASEFERQKQVLKAALQTSRSVVHFNVDTWTSKTMAEYQAIVAFFITPEGQRKKALLALPELDAGHAGSECGARFIATIEDYGIERQLGYMTCDNASANNTMCRYIEGELGTRSVPILWKSEWRRCRCLGHIINLCCQAFMSAPDEEAIDYAVQQSQRFAPERTISVDTLFGDVLSDEEDDLLEGSREDNDSDESPEERLPRKRARRSTAVSQRAAQSQAKKERRRGGWRLQGPIRTLRRFFVWVKKDTARKRLFKSLSGLTPVVGNDTRWNSWDAMLLRGLQTRSTVDEFMARKDCRYNLTVEDWKLIEETHKFLQPFHEVTNKAQRDDATFDKVLFYLDFLRSHLSKSRETWVDNQAFTAAIMMCWYAFDKWFLATEETPVYAAAVLLHPSRRLRYLQQHWPTRWYFDAERQARDLWKAEYQSKDIGPAGEGESDIGGSGEEPTELELYERTAFLAPEGDEFDRFISQPQSAVSDAIAWWLEPTQQRDYPRLSQMAIDILSIPPMSAEAERVFSGARRTISWERAALGSVSVERGECLKSWSLQNISLLGESENDAPPEVSEAPSTPTL